MSDANRISLAYVEESAYGTIPSGPPTLTRVRLTGESLGQNTGSTTSQELRSDRQIADLVRNDVDAGGEINFELSYGAFDTFFEAALLSADWEAEVEDVDTVYSITTSGTILHRSTGSFVTDGFLLYQWIRVSGFNATNQPTTFFAKIAAITATDLTLSNISDTLVDEAEGDTVTVTQGEYIENGTESRSFSMERTYSDLSNEFARYRGMIFDGFNLNMTPDAIVTGAFSLLGKDEASATATFGDGSDTAAAANDVLNAIDHVKTIFEGGTAYASNGFSINLANNHRARKVLGTLGAASIGTGTIDVTGSLSAYYSSKTLADKYLNFTASSLALRILDASSNAYVIDMPRVKYSNARRVGGGINTDVLMAADFQAIRHPSENKTIRIVRWAA